MPVQRDKVPPHRRREYVAIGQLFWTADEIRAFMRRQESQWQAMKRAVDGVDRGRQEQPSGDFPADPLGVEWRQGFASSFQAWIRFRFDTCTETPGDPCATLRGGPLAQAGWGGTVEQAEDYERDLQSWRRQFAERTGRTPPGPETTAVEEAAAAAAAPGPTPGQVTLRFVAGAAAVVGVAWAVSEVAKTARAVAPALAGEGADDE